MPCSLNLASNEKWHFHWPVRVAWHEAPTALRGSRHRSGTFGLSGDPVARGLDRLDWKLLLRRLQLRRLHNFPRCKAFSKTPMSLKIPTFYLQRIDMEIGCEHVPRDNRLSSITRIRPAATVGKLVAPPGRQPEPGIPISQTDKVR